MKGIEAMKKMAKANKSNAVGASLEHEAELFWFLADNYIRLRLGILAKDKEEKLNSMDRGLSDGTWISHVEKELGIDKTFFVSDALIEIIVNHFRGER